MRLTLRTLLAWLDDTLPPSEVKQMGQQVAESPFAQDLVERIHRVTRQRRLTVPGGNGQEGVDPNIVAAYLDSELGSEEVADYERRCLKSDTLLAEVASVHQVLSLIGQKAKVPNEAKWRMYRLIKGPEVGARVAKADVPATPKAQTPTWGRSDLPRPTFWGRFGPVIGVVGLVALLAFSAWRVIGPAPLSRDASQTQVAQADRPQPKRPSEDLTPPIENQPVGPVETPDVEMPEGDLKTPTPAPPAVAQPANALGVVDAAGPGMLLRRGEARNEWERLATGTALKPGDVLMNFRPFHNPVRLGPVQVVLDGAGLLQIVSGDETAGTQINLERGRIVVRDATGPIALLIAALDRDGDGRSIVLRPVLIQSSLAPLAIERLPRPDPSAPVTLRVSAAGGKLVIRSPDAENSFDAPTSVDVAYNFPEKLAVDAMAAFAPKLGEVEGGGLPDWATDQAPPPIESQLAELFAKQFKPGADPVLSLAEALNASPQAEVRELALAALGDLDLELVLSALQTRGKRADRQAAIRVLRDLMARGPEDSAGVKMELGKVGGKNPEWAATVFRMLRGFNAAETRQDATYTTLVKLLDHADVEVRELALDNLMAITKRDNLGYDPDTPSIGPGLKEWQKLLATKKLKP